MDLHAVAEYVRFWAQQPVPMRPSVEGLKHYARAISARKFSRVLICGGTPELADLAIELKASKVTRIDLSGEILAGMEALAKQNWRDIESVSGDWLAVVIR